mmetsp:Transcript_18693/g.51146  ORF Transcript_18693/g.51146 Transcript_18693/m.51146 type:complete len:245 (+) Transcript_18693:212-946(+)
MWLLQFLHQHKGKAMACCSTEILVLKYCIAKVVAAVVAVVNRIHQPFLHNIDHNLPLLRLKQRSYPFLRRQQWLALLVCRCFCCWWWWSSRYPRWFLGSLFFVFLLFSFFLLKEGRASIGGDSSNLNLLWHCWRGRRRGRGSGGESRWRTHPDSHHYPTFVQRKAWSHLHSILWQDWHAGRSKLSRRDHPHHCLSHGSRGKPCGRPEWRDFWVWHLRGSVRARTFVRTFACFAKITTIMYFESF